MNILIIKLHSDDSIFQNLNESFIRDSSTHDKYILVASQQPFIFFRVILLLIFFNTVKKNFKNLNMGVKFRACLVVHRFNLHGHDIMNKK